MASNRYIAKKKKQNTENESQIFNRVLAAFAVTLIVEILMVLVYRSFYSNGELGTPIPYAQLKWIFAVLCVASAASSAALLKKGKRWGIHMVELAVLFLLLAGSCYLLTHFGIEAAKLLCVLFPVAVVLYIFLLMYQREFFFCTLLCVCAIVSVSVMRSFEEMNFITIVASILTAVFTVLFAIGACVAGKDGKVAGKLTVFEMKGGRIVILLACILSAAALAAVIFKLSAIYGICVFVLAAYIFIAAVYHTAKLM